MCGVAGYLGEEKLSKVDLNKSLKMMFNRGPDFQSYVKKKNK